VGDYRNGYITTTPKGKDDTYEFFVGDKAPTRRKLSEATVYDSKDRMAIVGVSTDTNPHTPDDYKEAMKADMPEEVRAQEVRGEFVEIGSGVLSTDMLSYETPDALEADWNWKWHVAVDLGIETNPRKARENDTDYWSLAVVAEHPWHDHAYLVDVRRRRGQGPDEAAQWIRKIIHPWPTETVKYEAVQAQEWFDSHLKEAGLHPIKYRPRNSKEERILGMSVLFSSEKVELIDWSGFPNHSVDWDPFRSEWLAYPEGSHDDVIDSVAQALEGVNFGGALEGMSGDMYGRESG
jgi:phage terminase large subunit-like protein